MSTPVSPSLSSPSSEPPITILYSRYEHGEVPVLVYPPPPTHGSRWRSRGTFEVHWNQSQDPTLAALGIQVYPSATKLLTALYNQGRTSGPDVRRPGTSFDRYFHLRDSNGKRADSNRSPEVTAGSALDLFGTDRSSDPLPLTIPEPVSIPRSRSGGWSRPLAAGVLATTLSLFSPVIVPDAQAALIEPDPITEEVRPSDIRSEVEANLDHSALWVSAEDPQPEVARPEVPQSPGTTSHYAEAIDDLDVAPITVEVPKSSLNADFGVVVADETCPVDALQDEVQEVQEVRDQSLAVETPIRGIDLYSRGHEVKLLLHAGFGLKMSARGYDPDDVLQEVYKGLITRNNGRCPFDPGKSSFGHYVHMVCDCVLKNYHRKQSRIREFEQIGLSAPASVTGAKDGEGWVEVDASLVAGTERGNSTSELEATQSSDPSEGVAEEMAMVNLRDWFDHLQAEAEAKGNDKQAIEYGLARDVLPLKAIGMTRAEIADQLDLPVGQVSKALSRLRSGTREWAVLQGLRATV